jgi:hypothetical protein
MQMKGLPSTQSPIAKAKNLRAGALASNGKPNRVDIHHPRHTYRLPFQGMHNRY